METKRILAGASVAVLLVLGAFAAGGISQSTTSAQVATPPAQSAPLGVTSPQNSPIQTAPQGSLQQAAPAQSAAQSAQTPEPTEVAAGTPEPTEVAGTPEPTEVAGTPEPTEVAGQDGDNVQSGDQSGSDTGEAAGAENEGAETPASEAADAQALASQAHISQQQAEQAALAANPGTTVTHSSLGDENGTIVYDVELSNGSDVKVDANSAAVIGTDQAGSDSSESEGTQGTSQP